MRNTLGKCVIERLSSALVLIALGGSGSFSVGIARPAFQAGSIAADGAKLSDDKIIELPGAFKDLASAKSNPASKSEAKARPLQSDAKLNSQIEIDAAKGRAGGSRIAAARSKRISIPASMLKGGIAHEFNATAYCLKGRTASGHPVRPGIIAADPRVLPLGTVVHLEAGQYSGVYTVLDTGARIRGRIIDVYIPTRREAIQFGRRPVKLKVIGPGQGE